MAPGRSTAIGSGASGSCRSNLRTPVAILQDLAGPKVRIGEVPGGETDLKGWRGILFERRGGGRAAKGRHRQLSANHRRNAGGGRHPAGRRQHRTEGGGEGTSAAGGTPVLRCRVVVGGVLRSHVGINFPGHSLSVPALTAKDYEDLRFGLAQGVDFVALSYVRSAQDVTKAREFIRSQGADTPIIAKIEKHEALGQLRGDPGGGRRPDGGPGRPGGGGAPGAGAPDPEADHRARPTGRASR